jgi:hypothetical protein
VFQLSECVGVRDECDMVCKKEKKRTSGVKTQKKERKKRVSI